MRASRSGGADSPTVADGPPAVECQPAHQSSHAGGRNGMPLARGSRPDAEPGRTPVRGQATDAHGPAGRTRPRDRRPCPARVADVGSRPSDGAASPVRPRTGARPTAPRPRPRQMSLTGRMHGRYLHAPCWEAADPHPYYPMSVPHAVREAARDRARRTPDHERPAIRLDLIPEYLPERGGRHGTVEPTALCIDIGIRPLT